METAFWSLLVSILALLVSLCSFGFARKSWHEANRPIVSAKAVPVAKKHQAVELFVTNSGNRPAVNVILSPQNRSDLQNSISPGAKDWERKSVESCFGAFIPIIRNGETLSAAFGTVAQKEAPGTWLNDPTVLNLKIEFHDLDGRKFEHYQPIRIASVDSFGATVFNRRVETVEEIIQVQVGKGSPKP